MRKEHLDPAEPSLGPLVNAMIEAAAVRRAQEVARILDVVSKSGTLPEVFAADPRRPGAHERETGRQISQLQRYILDEKAEIQAANRTFDVAEQELKRQLQLTEELSRTGSFRWNLKTGEDHWSDNFYRLLGYQPNDRPATTDAFLARMHPEDREPLFRQMLQATQMKEPFEVEFRLAREDGTVVSCRSRGRPEGADYYIGVLMDVSELRETEKTLRRTELALSRVSQRTEMGELAASIAHDLNQPLTSIAANAGAARRWLGRPVPDIAMARESLTCLIHDAKRAVSVLRGMQDLGTTNATSSMAFRLDEVVAEVVAASAAAADTHSALVLSDLHAGDTLVCGIPVQVQQVIYNLILNGLEAMDEVKDRQRVVKIRSAVLDNETVEVVVEDAGNGIANDTLPHIFDSFFTTKTTGMGLGLSICRSMLERHKGTLSVESEMGLGSRFRMTLPIAASGSVADQVRGGGD